MNYRNKENSSNNLQPITNTENVSYSCMNDVKLCESSSSLLQPILFQNKFQRHEVFHHPSIPQTNITDFTPRYMGNMMHDLRNINETESIIDLTHSHQNLSNKRHSDDYNTMSNKRSRESETFDIDNVSTGESRCENMIYNLLLKSFRGKIILAAIDCDKRVKSTPPKIQKYVHKLAMHVVENKFNSGNFDIKRERFTYLGGKICELIDGELPEEWYSPSNGNVSARGYLYIAYRKLRTASIELGIFGGSVKDISSKKSPEESADDIYQTDKIDDKLKSYWVSQFDIRKKFFKSLTVQQLLVLYPCLGCSSGFELILVDFYQIFKERATKLINIWPEVSKKILKIADEEKDSSDVKIFMSQNVLANPEVLAFFILPYILKAPRNTIIPIKGKKITTQDFVDIFILQTKDFKDLEVNENLNMIYARVKSIYDKIENDDVKPFILVCGELKNITAVYVVMSKEKIYKVDSLVKAVDIFIKCSILMKEANSKFCRHITQFFEYYIFEINNKSIYATVLKLTKSLNMIKNGTITG